MATKKFSQFTNTPTPNANSFFVGYNSVTNDNGRTSLSDLITAIGAPSGSGTANFVSKWSGTNTLTDSLIQDNGDVVQVYGISENLLYLDKTQPNSYLLSTDFSGILNTTKLVTIGDVYENYNGTNIVVDLDAQIIKTRNGADKGLYIDYPNGIYGLGYTESGDFVGEEVIGFSAKGYVFKMGDPSGLYNRTYFEIDDENFFIKTSSSGADKGLYIDYSNSIYALGFTDGGNPFTDPVDGFVYTSNYTTIGSVWNWGEYIEIKHIEQRIYLETNRLHYRNLTTTQINALTSNIKGDVVFNSTLNTLCFWNGTSWRKVTDSAM